MVPLVISQGRPIVKLRYHLISLARIYWYRVVPCGTGYDRNVIQILIIIIFIGGHMGAAILEMAVGAAMLDLVMGAAILEMAMGAAMLGLVMEAAILFFLYAHGGISVGVRDADP